MSDQQPMDDATFQAGAAKVTADDAKKVVSNAQGIIDKILSSDTLKGLLEDVKALVSLVTDFVTGKYTDVPWKVIAAVVFALMYLLSPVDIIPDFIPILGLTDDAAVLMLCLRLIHGDLSAYREWQAKQVEVKVEKPAE